MTYLDSEVKRIAREEGIKARGRAEPVLNNPHSNSVAREAWHQGWMAEDKALRLDRDEGDYHTLIMGCPKKFG